MPRERLRTVWCGPGGTSWLLTEIATFRQELAALPAPAARGPVVIFQDKVKSHA